MSPGRCLPERIDHGARFEQSFAHDLIEQLSPVVE